MAIINTDCRNNMYLILKDCGFIIAKLTAEQKILRERRKARGDITLSNTDAQVECHDKIELYYTIDNSGTKDDLRSRIELMIWEMIYAKKA